MMNNKLEFNINNEILKIGGNSDDEIELKNTIIESYKLKTIKLHEIVGALEQFLVHNNPSERCIGVRFLADILHGLSHNGLSSADISFLSQFMVDRLKDHHSVTPSVIYGILALVQQNDILKEDLNNVLTSLFHEVHCQSLLVGDRKNLYSIIQTCLYKKLHYVKDMGTAFVLGFISMVDGEKDPRNLVFVFSFYPYLAQNMTLGTFAEDLFEIAASYFPIDFIPPKEDKLCITKDDLVLGLRQCIASTDEFSAFSVPFLIEKLSAEGLSAKLDALDTLKACCATYSASSLSVHLMPLWTELKNQVIENWNEDVEKATLSTLSSVIEIIDQSHNNVVQSNLMLVAESAFNECSVFLSQPEQRLMVPSSELLLSFIRPSKSLTDIYAAKVMEILNGVYLKEESMRGKRGLMCVFAKFLFHAFNHDLIDQGCFPFLRDAFFGHLYQAILEANPSMTEASIIQFTFSLKCFTVHQKQMFCTNILNVIKTLDLALRKASILCLNVCYQVTDSFLRDFAHELLITDSPMVPEQCTLDILSQLKLDSLSMGVVWFHLWEQFHHCMKECLFDDAYRIINTLAKIVCEAERQLVDFIEQQSIGLAKVLQHILTLTERNTDIQYDILEQLSVICRELTISSKDNVLQYLLMALIGYNQGTPAPGVPELLVPEINNDCLIIYAIMGITVPRKKLFHTEFWKKCISYIMELFVCCANNHVTVVIAKTLSSLTNRAPDECVEFILSEATKVPEGSRNRIVLNVWITKALIMRGHNQRGTFIRELEQGLLSQDFGEFTADAYEVLLQDYPRFFHSSLGSNIRLLYKQHYLEERMDILIKQFNTNHGASRLNTLVAIAHLLRAMPYAALVPHIQSILPVLLQCLLSDRPFVQNGGTGTMEKLIVTFPDNCSQHLPSLIPPLLKLSTTSTCFDVRLSALKCLCALVNLPAIKIMPYKEQVVLGLKKALGDKKRIIRTAATYTRSAWDVLGTMDD